MKTKNLIFGGVFIIGGFLLVRNFLNKKVEAEKPKLNYNEKNTDKIIDIKGNKVNIPLKIQEQYYKMGQSFKPNTQGISEIGVPYDFEINPDFSKIDFSDWVKK